jgi:hypothetical protein
MQPIALMSALLAAVVLCGATAAQAQDQFLTGDQIKAAWTGKKLFARSGSAGLLDMQLRADGTAQVSVGNMNDTGTWRVTDDGYCAKWQRIRQGAEACFKVMKRGDRTYTVGSDGAITSEVLRVSE